MQDKMSTKTHPLFTAYPLQNNLEISVDNVPTPYHVYDGHGLLIGGTADFATVAHLFNCLFDAEAVSQQMICPGQHCGL